MSNSTPPSDSRFDPQEAVLSQTLGSREPSCPPLRLLLAAGQDALPEDVERGVQEHKERCSLCQGLLADLAVLQEAPLSDTQLARMMPRVVPDVMARPSRGGAISWPIYAMAAALLVMVVSWLTFHRRSVSVEPQTAVTHVAPPPPVRLASVQVPRLPLAPPDTDTTQLLTRGGSGKNPSVEELMPAFAAYNKGDYQRAVDLFQPLVSAYPKGDIARLYMGVSQLMLHQDDAAYTSLSAVMPTVAKTRMDAAQWYTAVAAQEIHPVESRRILSALCAKEHSAYSAQSCSIIRASQQ